MASILEPFAQITPGLTASLMRGVPSAFMDDSDKGTAIFRRTVELAIQYLENMFKNADPLDPNFDNFVACAHSTAETLELKIPRPAYNSGVSEVGITPPHNDLHHPMGPVTLLL